MGPWAIWLIGAAVIAGVEALSGELFLLMVASGAAAGGVAALLGSPVWLQVVVFIVVAIVMVTTVRPIAKRALGRSTPEIEDGARQYLGRIARVSQPVDAHGGRVMIGGDEWSALALTPHDEFAVGRSVRIVEIRGAHAIVTAVAAYEE